MNATYLLLLCIAVAITSSLSQEMTSIPQEIPENTINCTVTESVFLTCACAVYKPSILEIMGAVTSLIPTAQGGNPGDPMNRYETQQSSNLHVATFSIGSIFRPGVLDILKNMSTRIGEDVFDKLCEGIPALQRCVDSGYKDSMKPGDVLIRKLFNLDNLGQALTSVCKLKAEIFGNLNCMTDAVLPMFACVTLSITNLPKQQSPLDMMSGDPMNTYCPLAGDVARCIAIQAKPCSSQLGTVLQNLLPTILSPSCGMLATKGTNKPLMATPIVCGLRSLPEIVRRVVHSFRTQTPQLLQAQISAFIDVFCGSDLLMCIHEELPSSMNSYDMFIKALVDVEQLTYADTIAQYICRPSRVQDIKNTIPCAMNKTDNIGVCFRTYVESSFDLSAIGVDAAKDRMTYCGPIKNITYCAIDTIWSPCDAGVASFFRDLYLTLLREDCNGVRNGPLASMINAQRQSAATILTNHSPLSIITILVLMFLFLH